MHGVIVASLSEGEGVILSSISFAFGIGEVVRTQRVLLTPLGYARIAKLRRDDLIFDFLSPYTEGMVVRTQRVLPTPAQASCVPRRGKKMHYPSPSEIEDKTLSFALPYSLAIPRAPKVHRGTPQAKV